MVVDVTDDRCERTDLIRSQCAHCTGRDGGTLARLERRRAARGRPVRRGEVAAQYDGKCAGCGDDYRLGMPIRSDGAGGWLAPCCAEEVPS